MTSSFNHRAIVTIIALSMVTLPASQAQSTNKDERPQAELLNYSSSTTTSASATAQKQPGDYVIGNEDILAISVWKEAELSRTLPVRSDGKITLPLVGEITAAGRTTAELQELLTANLRPYISEPAVTVIVQEMRSTKFNIFGHVQKPGTYVFSPPTTVMDAIALAGGFKDFAKSKSIYVLRSVNEHETSRLPFNYRQVIKGIHPEQNIMIRPHDTIVVP